MASIKNVKTLNYDLNIPQVQCLEGEALQAEQLKLQQIMAKKAGTYHNANNTTVRVNETSKWKAMGEITNEYTPGATFERKDYAIWVNGVLTKFSATSEKPGFTEEKGVKVSVNFTGEQLVQRMIEQQLKF